MQRQIGSEFHINTMRRQRHYDCDTPAIIAGSNGAVGFLLARALQQQGCDVSLFTAEPAEYIETERFYAGTLDQLEAKDEEHFVQGSVLYLLFYPLETFDIPRDANAFVHSLYKKAERAGFSRIVFVTEVAGTEQRDENEWIQYMRHAMDDGNGIPITHIQTSLLFGGETALEKEFSQIKASVLTLPYEAFQNECTPLHINDLVEYLCQAHSAELPRSYVFEAGGPDTVSFRDTAKIIAERTSNDIRVSMGERPREWVSQFWFSKNLRGYNVLSTFVARARFSMVADTEAIRNYYEEIEPRSFVEQ